jgi:hypothetical protein
MMGTKRMAGGTVALSFRLGKAQVLAMLRLAIEPLSRK